MPSDRTNKIREELMHAAANFLQQNSNRTSMITVTNVDLSRDSKSATIFFTVLPETSEAAALDFAMRRRSEFTEFVHEHTKIARVPMVIFAIDGGEKNRQHIDRLSEQAKG